MTYEKKCSIRWTPRVTRRLALCSAVLFTTGGIVGFAVGSIVKPREKVVTPPTPSTVVTAVTTVPTATTTTTLSTTVTTQPTEVKKVYYDCPLDTELQDYIRELCDENNVSMPLVLAMIECESSFQADAISESNDYGLMQINEGNHDWLSKEYGITDFLDPYQNVLGGITIISQHYERFQDVDKALMAYNMGAGGAKGLWDKGIYETSYSRNIKAAMEGYINEI